jgi:hypothetical protein
MAKRKNIRVEMNRTVELHGSRGRSQGIVRDFSPSGCCIHQPAANVHCGMRLTLRISLPDRIEPLEIKPAVVTWTGQNAFGVEFLTLSPETRLRMKQVHNLLWEAQTAEDPERVLCLSAFA